METLFLKLINISITATYFIVAILFLRFIFRHIPKKIYCALWGIAGLRLILPFSIESIFSLVPSAETIPIDIIYQRNPQINSGMSFVNNSLNPIISESFAPSELTSANPLQIWSTLLSVLWLFVFICLILYMLTSYILLRYRMRSATFYRDNIWQSDKTDSPFVLGIIKPRIYIPYNISESDIQYVISHEKAHIRRGDHFYKPIGFLLLSIYWFNPFIWIAYILLCRDIEMACDEKVISKYEIDEKRAYSSALLNCSIKRHRIAACPLAFGEIGIKERIKGIMSYKKPAFWLIVASVVLSIILSVCFLTNPSSSNVSIDDFKLKSYAVTSVEYKNSDYVDEDIEALSFVISEEKELGLIIDMDPEHYFLTSIAMTRPFSNSYLKKITLTKQNFDSLFDSSCFLNNISEEKLRKENKRAWITSGTPIGNSSDTYILLCQNDGQLYMVSATDNKATYVFAIKEAASPFDVNDLSSISINEYGADVLTDKSTIGWNSYYVGSGNASKEFTQYVLDSKYITYGSITPLPSLEINTEAELLAFLERHKDVLDYNATIEHKYTIGETAPLSFMLTHWDDEFFSHSKLVFICIASKGGYRYEIESLGISTDEFRANVAQIGNYGDGDGYSNWIIAISMSKDIPAAKVDRYEAISVLGEDKYVYEDHDSYMKPYFVVRAKQGFILSFSSYSSYYASGTIEYSGNEMIMNSIDGKKYVFEKSGDNYIFVADKSSEVPKFKEDATSTVPEACIPDGAVFVFQDKGILSID